MLNSNEPLTMIIIKNYRDDIILCYKYVVNSVSIAQEWHLVLKH